MSDNIKVVVKVRPLIPREIEDKQNYQWRVKNNTLYQLDQSGNDVGTSFTFDKVYDVHTKTSDVYDDVAKPIVEAATAGFNGTIFAYGQTSSGKTYTMTGTEDAPGIIQLAVLNLFKIIKNIPNRDFLVRVSYIEIYNETLIDLLALKKAIKIVENLQGVKVNATERMTTSPEEVLKVMKEGKANRQTGATNMNEESSRSHSIFQITIESREHVEGEEQAGSVNVSQLNLVDLAGSERSGQTGATGIRFIEGTHINKSLSALALVIKQLSEGHSSGFKHVNYRDSKLTRILQNSLGGNAKTSIICAVTPAAIEETISTLQFANRAKAIKNTPEVNAVATNKTMIQSLTKQLSTLRTQLENKKTLEQDNFKLHKEIQRLQKLILNGFVENSRRKALPPRRMTISTLHPIQEDPPAIPSFCTPSLKYNPLALSLASVSENFPVHATTSLSSVAEEPPRLITPPPPDKKVNFIDEVIEIDSDDDSIADVKTCSPYHKCYNSSKTPPCILRKNAKQAERNLKDIVELTEREKIYTPNVVELMEKLENKSSKIAELEEKLNYLGKTSKEKDIEMDKLKASISKAEEQIAQITSAKEELEKACKDYNTKITDWEVSFETLKKKSKTREDELLSLLEEHENKIKSRGKISSTAIDKEINFVNIPSGHENSITNKIETELPENQSLIIDLKSQMSFKDQTILELDANLQAQKLRIDSLMNINKELQDMVSNYKEKVSYLENENSLFKSTIENLNNKVENQKSMLETLREDVNSYNSIIQDYQVKLSNKNNDRKEISDNDIEIVLANEQLFIANNENISNIVQSLRNALDIRNEEIKHLKSGISNMHERDVELLEEVRIKKEEILVLKNEIEKLKFQENENISLIDKLVQEKKDLSNIEFHLKIQISGIQKDKELLEKQNDRHKLDLANLKEYNERISKELSHKESEIVSSNELKSELEKMSQVIKDLENEITVKEEMIKSLKNDDEEIESNKNKAKVAIEKVEKIMLLFTEDIINIPNIIDSLVAAFNILNDNLTSLETMASQTIKEKHEYKKFLEQRENELQTLQFKMDDFKNEVNRFCTDFHSEFNTSCDQIIKTGTSEDLKSNLLNLMSITKSIKTCLEQSLKVKEEELNLLKSEYHNNKIEYQKECSKTLEYSTQIHDLTLHRDQLLQNILTKVVQMTSEFDIENNISCNLTKAPDNTYEEISLTLEKVANHLSILKYGNITEQSNLEMILTDAKIEIQQLTKENLKLLQDICYLENDNTMLSNQIKTVQEDCKSTTRDLKESNNLINQLQRDLLTKTTEMNIIQSKAAECAQQFKNLQVSMKEQIGYLEIENTELKSRCSEIEIQNNDVIKRDIFSSGHTENCNKSNVVNHYIDHNSPPSLLTICCNRIIEAIQPSENNSLSTTSTTNVKDEKYNKICRCEALLADLDNLEAENHRLKYKIDELENNKEIHVREQEEVKNEVRLLLEYTHELQRKILNHRTNLSTLTATTYAENKSLSSQVKVLQHHHSRFHKVCLRDIPEVKKQLQFLMTVLKSDNLVKMNDSFKRFSLPSVLDTTSLHSTFKNESTIDGDFLMLDTNVTLTTCDNTLLGNEQTCFDVTQVCTFNEVASQTDIYPITTSHVSTPQIVTESVETFKLIEALESLKMENHKLRDLVEDYSKNLAIKIDAQSSPIKKDDGIANSFPSSPNMSKEVDSCGDCKHEDEMKILEEKLKLEIQSMSHKLMDLETQRAELEQKYRNLSLEIPDTELLMRKLSCLEKDISKKQNEVDILTDSLNKKNKEIKNLQEENDSLSNQVMESISEVDDLKKEQDSLKASNNNLMEKLTKLEQECSLRDEIISSLESKISNSHAKLDRSYSEADTSSRYNKICTLQSELHAGKEDCIELKEEVTTIKNHLERSNLSMDHAMDLDESIGVDLMRSFKRNFDDLKSNEAKFAQINVDTQLINVYNDDKVDCINYYTNKTGVDKKSINCDIKVLDVMIMLHDYLNVKHSREIENFVNKLKDFEETKIKLEKQILNLNDEQSQVTKELEVKNSYLQTMANIVLQVKTNLAIINEEMICENVINSFSEKFLNKIDKEFGFSSTIIFETMMENVCAKFNNQIEQAMKENQELEQKVHEMTTEVNSINQNLLTMQSQLTEKISEIDNLERKNENILKINSTVTLDIVNKENALKKIITNYYEKYVKNNVVKPDIDFSLPPVQILQSLLEHFSTQCKSNEEKFESEKTNIIMEIDQLKTSLQERERDLSSQISLHNDLNQIYQKKTEENDAHVSAIKLLTDEVRILKETIVNRDSQIVSLDGKLNSLIQDSNKHNEAKTTELLKSSAILQQEIENLKSMNAIILKEKDACTEDLSQARVTIKEYETNLENLKSEIAVLKKLLNENSQIIETLRNESKSLLEENKGLQSKIDRECDKCTKLSNNIKTHERTAQIQSSMINRLQKQKEEIETEMVEKTKVTEELKEKCKHMESQCETTNNELQATKQQLEVVTNAKKLLEDRISELESEVRDKSEVFMEVMNDNARRRRQSIQDSKRIFSDDSQDHAKMEAVFKSRSKGDEMFMDVDDESSSRSTPARLSVGRDSLLSKHDQSESGDQSRPGSAVERRRRRQSLHDAHRSVPATSLRHIPSRENSRDSSRNNSIECEVTQLRKQLSSCQQELEELKEKYREVDEECEICAQYLRERDEQCMRLKQEKKALEASITELQEKLSSIPNASQLNAKKTYTHASVNTDEDWANLHSVVVDRMSYNAEVEKNKKLVKTIEELRYKNQDLNTAMTKMRKSMEKYNIKDSKELEITKAELSSCKQELEELREKYKELDEECETCAEYLRERDEQCRKLREAKASLEVKLEEYKDLSNVTQSVRKRRHTLHDQNRSPAPPPALSDACTETSEDFLTYQVEKDSNSHITMEEHTKEIDRLKKAVERLSVQKASLEQQLRVATPVYVATGSAIVQNQQITDVMKENQKLKKMNAKLITLCKKRGKTDANRENEDPENILLNTQ